MRRPGAGADDTGVAGTPGPGKKPKRGHMSDLDFPGGPESESSVTTMLDPRAQVDAGWIDANIAAIVEDFLRAQLDLGYKTKAQISPGLKTMAQIRPGLKARAQLDPGTKSKAQLDPGN